MLLELSVLRSSTCSALELQEHCVALDATVAAQPRRLGALLGRSVASQTAVAASRSVEVQRVGVLLELALRPSYCTFRFWGGCRRWEPPRGVVAIIRKRSCVEEVPG